MYSMCCSVLQCVAVCCNVVQCVVVSNTNTKLESSMHVFNGAIRKHDICNNDSFICVTYLVHMRDMTYSYV